MKTEKADRERMMSKPTMTLFMVMVRKEGEVEATAVEFAHDFSVGRDTAREFQKKLPTATVTLRKLRCESIIEYEVM